MKHLKKYENIDWDFDFEEEYPVENIKKGDTFYVNVENLNRDLDWTPYFKENTPYVAIDIDFNEVRTKSNEQIDLKCISIQGGYCVPYKYCYKKIDESFDFNDEDFDFEEDDDKVGEEIKVIYDDLFDVEVYYSKILKVINPEKVVISYKGNVCYADYRGKNWFVGDDIEKGENITKEMIIQTYIDEFDDRLVPISKRMNFARNMDKFSDYNKLEIYDMIKNYFRK